MSLGASRPGGASPRLVPVAEIIVRLGEPLDFGETRDGRRRFTPILGGELRGLGVGESGLNPVETGSSAGGLASGSTACDPPGGGVSSVDPAGSALWRLRARILPGGGDRQLVWRSPDGAGAVAAGAAGAAAAGAVGVDTVGADTVGADTVGTDVVGIDARYDARAENGALIAIRATGVRRALPAAPAQGQAAPGSSVYFRVALRFETSDPDLAELQDSLFVADGARLADEVRHTVYRVA